MIKGNNYEHWNEIIRRKSMKLEDLLVEIRFYDQRTNELIETWRKLNAS